MAGLLTEKIRESQKRKGLLDLWSGLLTDTGLPELFSGKIGGQTLEQGIQNRLQPNSLRPALSPQQMVEAGLNIAGVAPVGATVWHGSPHKFSKFDMSKIGTGEGAQAYGHGLYMAESPAVAKAYQDKLQTVNYGGSAINPSDPSHVARSFLQQFGDSKKAAQALRARAEMMDYEINTAAAEMLESGKSIPERVAEGALYKVDIPDESIPRMLDWDKPLSEQAQEIQSAFAAANEKVRGFVPQDMSRIYGSELKSLVAGREPEYTQVLKESGIPGIRYLDGGSRNAGQGTSNYVLFDDQLPRILERNGEPTGLQPWAPGEANSLLGIQSAPMRPRNALGQEIPGLYPWAVPFSAGLLGSLSLLPSDAEAR